VAEGTSDAGFDAEKERPEDFEKRGEGINTFAYWVTNAPESGNWSLLPDIEPVDIKTSRITKLVFSGNLDAKVFTNPYFFKTESYLLRAQICRIAHSTTLVPLGVYKMQEESQFDIELNETEDGPVKIPSTSEMSKREAWGHYSRGVLKCGRINHLEPTQPDAEVEIDIEELKKIQEKSDSYCARLGTIANDGCVKGGLPAWQIRTIGDTNSYASANPLHAN